MRHRTSKRALLKVGCGVRLSSVSSCLLCASVFVDYFSGSLHLASGSFLNSFLVNFDHAYREILCTHRVIIMSSRRR
jgi:hypothetical protein